MLYVLAVLDACIATRARDRASDFSVLGANRSTEVEDSGGPQGQCDDMSNELTGNMESPCSPSVGLPEIVAGSESLKQVLLNNVLLFIARDKIIPFLVYIFFFIFLICDYRVIGALSL